MLDLACGVCQKRAIVHLITETTMPTMSNSRRKQIQAKQRKATNAQKRTAKAAKRVRNKATS